MTPNNDIDYNISNPNVAVFKADQDYPPSVGAQQSGLNNGGIPFNLRFVDPMDLLFKSDEQRYDQ